MEEIIQRNVWPHKSQLKEQFINEYSGRMIFCNTPDLVLFDFYNTYVQPTLASSFLQSLDIFQRHFIFVSSKDFQNASKKNQIRQVCRLNTEITLIIKWNGVDDLKKHCKFLNSPGEPQNFIFVGNDRKQMESIINFIKKPVNKLELSYQWEDLDENSRDLLLKSRLNFQGQEITFNELLKDLEFPPHKLPVDQLVNQRKIVIEASRSENDKYDADEYVDRKFKNYENFDELLSSLKTQKYVLLSGDAGIVKSIITTHISLKIKERFKEFWITRVNLHEHIEAFKYWNNETNIMNFIYTKLILKGKDDESLNSESFEEELFKQLYNKERFFLFLDGADEIAPQLLDKCKSFLDKVFREKQANIWICARSHLVDDIKQVLPDHIHLEFEYQINKDFVREFNYSNINHEESDFPYDNFRLLRLTCFDFANLKKLCDNQRLNFILNSPNCFIIVIELKNTDNALISGEIVSTLETLLNGNKKYFMINLFSAKMRETFLYYKGELKHIEKDESENDKNIHKFIRSLLKARSILDCQLSLRNVKENIERAISDDDSLFLRLMMAFDVKHENEFMKSTLETIIKRCSAHTLASFFDLPIVDLGCSYPQTKFIKKALEYEFASGVRILSLAARDNNSNVVSMLLRMGADVEQLDNKGKSACDYALEGEKDENLKLLIENDARFPLEFKGKMPSYYQTSQSNVKKQIFEIYQQRVNFHKSITNSINEGNDTESVIKEYRSSNPSIKFAFTLSESYPYSKSIMATALEHKNYDVYVSLERYNFARSGFDKETFENLQEQVKHKINTLRQQRKFTGCKHSEILDLISKTKIEFKIEHNENSEKFEFIKSVYEYLNSIEDIFGIFKIVIEQSNALSIVVDFKNKSVNVVDHTTKEGVDGITHNHSGRIFVSADGKSKEELSGVVIHELCHFALYIIFQNDSKPYFKTDEKLSNEFEELVNEIKAVEDNHEYVQAVYKYPKPKWPSELIARVPQLIASEERNILEKKYPKLLKYFHDNVTSVVRKVIENPKRFREFREIQQLNDDLGHIEEIIQRNVWPHKSQLKESFINNNSGRMIFCNTPDLVLSDFYKTYVQLNLTNSFLQSLDSFQRHLIFASSEDFQNASRKNQIRQVWRSNTEITLIIKWNGVDDLQKHCKFLNSPGEPQNFIFVGSDRKQMESLINFINKPVNKLELSYQCDLDENSRVYGKKLLIDLIDHTDTYQKLREMPQMVLNQCDIYNENASTSKNNKYEMMKTNDDENDEPPMKKMTIDENLDL